MGNFVLNDWADLEPFHRTISFPRRRDGFHIMPTSAGHEMVIGPDYDWDGLRRGNTPFSVLQHTIEGAGRLRYEQRTFRVDVGETMLVTIPHNHRYWLERGEDWSFFWIAFSGQEAMRLHQAIIHSVGPVFRLLPATVKVIADTCMRFRAGIPSAGEASFEAYRATMAIYDDVVAHEEGTSEVASHMDIDRAISHIRTSLSSSLDVTNLATVAGMSRAHFSRMFKKHTGMSPAEFVLKERMERAAKLLSDTKLSVKQVSLYCGFADPNYFSKAFRRTYATSPVEFRTTGMFAARR